MSSLITMDDLSDEDIQEVLDAAERLLPVAKGDIRLPLLQGRILGNLFFEPSTRTRMSFETAMKRLALATLLSLTAGAAAAGPVVDLPRLDFPETQTQPVTRDATTATQGAGCAEGR